MEPENGVQKWTPLFLKTLFGTLDLGPENGPILRSLADAILGLPGSDFLRTACTVRRDTRTDALQSSRVEVVEVITGSCMSEDEPR